MLSRKNIIKYGSLIYWGIILVGAIVGLFGDIQGDIVEMSIQSFTAKQFVAFFLRLHQERPSCANHILRVRWSL